MVRRRLDDLERFYTLLADLADRVGGARKLKHCTGYMDWPDRGVYIFLEPGETRTLTHRANWDDGTVERVRTAGGWVTVEVTVRSDEATTTFVGTHQVG